MSQLLDLLDSAVESRLVDVHTALPGRVVSYDAAAQTANIEPTLRRALQDEDGAKVLESLPIIPCVPVLFPRGGGCFVSFPLARGDGGLLIFSERSIDRWRSTGEVADPGDVRMHGLSGAIFIPGLFSMREPIADASATAMRLGVDGGPQVEITDAGVSIGLGATEGIALGTALASFLTQLGLWIATHSHPANGSVPTQVATYPATGQIESYKHKVEA